MTFSLTALVALLMGLFFLALSGPGWGACVSPRESGNRARTAGLSGVNLTQGPLRFPPLLLADRAWVREPAP